MKSNQEVYKLVDLRKLYDNRLHQLGSEWIDEHAHQGRFKEHLLKKLGSGWSGYSKGRDVYISHDKSVGKALEKTAGCQVTEDEADKIVEEREKVLHDGARPESGTLHSILERDSGPKGLYGQEEEKEMIELSKPEVLSIVHEFQNACFKETTKRSTEHPEASSAEQSKFLKHLKALVSLVDEDRVVNPFTKQGPELVTLDTGEVMDPAIVDGLKEAKSIGKKMQVEFVRERLETGNKPLSDVIPRTNVYTFANRPPADLKRGRDKLGSARANAALTTKMFMSLLARPESDMAEFFKHENRREPPSLTQDSKLRMGTKSVVVTCLPSMPDPGRSIEAKEATVRVFDMAAIVHMIKPQCAHLFGEYSAMQLMPFLEGQMTTNTLRIDLIWDTYSETSLKSQTREKRSQQAGRRTRVAAQIPIPKGAQWATFLEDAENKDELFRFVSEELHNLAANKDYHLITTKDDCVLTNMEIDTSTLCPCSHEEADTRMMLHLCHAADEDLPDVSEACSLLVRCGCAVACKGNCKCHRAGLHCSQLCKCQGGCTNND
ncbi:hypothetical protein ACOMHN_041846 [Nucella lapillus]